MARTDVAAGSFPAGPAKIGASETIWVLAFIIAWMFLKWPSPRSILPSSLGGGGGASFGASLSDTSFANQLRLPSFSVVIGSLSFHDSFPETLAGIGSRRRHLLHDPRCRSQSPSATTSRNARSVA